MRSAEGVVLALGALGEAGESSRLAQGADAVAPPGEDLVRIGLMADVPDHPVARRVEDIMQGDGQLDDAKPRAKMAPGHGDRVYGFLTQFVGEAPEVRLGEFAQFIRRRDPVEQRKILLIGQLHSQKGRRKTRNGRDDSPGPHVVRRRKYTRKASAAKRRSPRFARPQG